MNPVQHILILLVRVYRVTLSPAKTVLFGSAGQCRFDPSCSQYAIEAVRTHGALAGGWLATKRICRCHPWGHCGEDLVPPVKSKVQGPKSKVEGGIEFDVRCSMFDVLSRRSAAKADRCSHIHGEEPKAPSTLDPRPSTLFLDSEVHA